MPKILDNVIKTDYWDIDAMADAIHAIISYPALYKQLREDGLAEVAQITWDKKPARKLSTFIIKYWVAAKQKPTAKIYN